MHKHEDPEQWNSKVRKAGQDKDDPNVLREEALMFCHGVRFSIISLLVKLDLTLYEWQQAAWKHKDEPTHWVD